VCRNCLSVAGNGQAFVSALEWMPWERSESIARRCWHRTSRRLGGWHRTLRRASTRSGLALARAAQGDDTALRERAAASENWAARSAGSGPNRSRLIGCSLPFSGSLVRDAARGFCVGARALSHRSPGSGVRRECVCDGRSTLAGRERTTGSPGWSRAERARLAIIGSVGGTSVCAWLIAQMASPALARACGERSPSSPESTRSRGTGREPPEGFQQGPPRTQKTRGRFGPRRTLPWRMLRRVEHGGTSTAVAFRGTRHSPRPASHVGVALGSLRRGYQASRAAAIEWPCYSRVPLVDSRTCLASEEVYRHAEAMAPVARRSESKVRT